jgi:hypothetical protein
MGVKLCVYCWGDLQFFWSSVISISPSNTFFKFGSKASLKELRNVCSCLGRGPWRSRTCVRGLDSLKLVSRCLRTQIRTSSEQQQLEKELFWCLSSPLACIVLWMSNVRLTANKFFIKIKVKSKCNLHNCVTWKKPDDGTLVPKPVAYTTF